MSAVNSQNRLAWLDQKREEYKNITVKEAMDRSFKEILSNTGGVTLPKLVEAAASLTIQTAVRAEDTARLVTVGAGAGKTFDIQRMTVPVYRTWTEGTALAAANPTLASVSGTLAQYGDVVQISDLLQLTSAVDFASTVGDAHGNTVQYAINDKIWTELKANTTNTVTKATAGDQSGAITFADVKSILQKTYKTWKSQPNFMVSGTNAFYSWITDNMTQVQFSTSMVDFIRNGNVVNILGCSVYIDPIFGDSAYTGAAGEEYLGCGKLGVSVAWGMRGPKFTSEIFRDPRELANYIVSYTTGGAKLVEDGSVGMIQHT